MTYRQSTLQTAVFVEQFFNRAVNLTLNKKVLLRERKRHTVRHVASARYAMGGYPVPGLRGGTPSQVWGGTPSQVWGGGTLSQVQGVPRHRSRHYPIQTWGVPKVPPPAGPGMGYPPSQTWDGVPPQT